MRSTLVVLALAAGIAGCPGLARAQAPSTDPTPTPWSERHRPVALTVELGGFYGLLMPSADHNFHSETRAHYRVNPAGPDFGLRAAFYPLAFLGGEIEGAVAPTSTDGGVGATLWTARAHLVAQLPLWRITPLVVLGGGRMGLLSNPNGNDSDPLIHFGAGVRLALNDLVSIRIDVRDNLTQQNGAPADTLTSHPEVLSSLTVRFYPRKKRVVASPPPVVDLDGDGFVGAADGCPERPGGSPDGCPAPDADEDGFPDRIDQCPELAGAAPHGCPSTDSDHDGFVDHIDRCPHRAGVEPDGCPAKDSDSDDIIDSQDRCRFQPETRNNFRDHDGCPDTIPERVRGSLGVLEGVSFVGGKHTLRPEAHQVLDGLVEMLKEYPEVWIRITSHTDGRGEGEYDVELSRRRAEAIRAYLVERGVEPHRIETRGAGADEPLASSATAAGRRRNRRIEVALIPHQRERESTSDEAAETAPVGEAPF